jgi:hypothetical protein
MPDQFPRRTIVRTYRNVMNVLSGTGQETHSHAIV